MERLAESKGGDSDCRRAIGGEFEVRTLQIGSAERLDALTLGQEGTWSISGRAALALVLRHLRELGVDHVHLPAYLCESILTPVKLLGMDYSFYPVDRTLTAHPDPPLGAAVLVIHYFGWLNAATTALRAEAGLSFHLIEDASQALLSDWSAPRGLKRYVILSPRKLGPTPFGGWCNTRAEVGELSFEAEALGWRSLAARLIRGGYLDDRDAEVDTEIEAFYLESFQAVEEYLDRQLVDVRPPQVALDLIAGLDWADIASRRRANWQLMDQLLREHVDRVTPALSDDVVPLGYVLRFSERDAVRASLASRRVFCPVHWPLPQEVSPESFPEAASLAQTCLTLPIDQRYGSDDIVRIADYVKSCV